MDPSLLPLILVVLFVATFAYVFKDIGRRGRAMLPVAEAAAENPVMYVCPVTVRMRTGNQLWHDLKTGWGRPAEVVVRQGFLEVGLTPASHPLTAQLGSFWIVWRVEDTTIHRERVGWLGTRLLSRDCIVLTDHTAGRGRPSQIAVSTERLNDLWNALGASGVKPEPQP